MFGCLYTYSLDRTKQIDRYRSISIIRNASPSKQQQQRRRQHQHSSGIRGGRISSIKEEEEELPWLVERKKLRFILEEMKIMAI